MNGSEEGTRAFREVLAEIKRVKEKTEGTGLLPSWMGNGVDWRSKVWRKICGEFRRKCGDVDLAREPQRF